MSFHSSTTRQLALVGVAGFALSLLGALPVSAHGNVGGGVAAGFAHPLLGLDHLFLLVGVGAAASFVSWQLLLFALGGALLGALFGGSGGGLPMAELLAALSISVMGLLILRSRRSGPSPSIPLYGTVVAGSVAIHGMLHGHEASGAAGWWFGALLGACVVSSLSFLVLRRLGTEWTARLAVLLTLVGAVLSLGPIGLMAGAGAG
jgi:urease accessory protein